MKRSAYSADLQSIIALYFFACFNVQTGVEARIWIGSGNNGLTFFPSRCRENFVLKRALSQPSISANSFKPTRRGITPPVHRSTFDKSHHQPLQAHHHLLVGILHTNMQL